MLNINAIRIEVNSVNGLFLCEHSFSKGLNIIKGNNTAGKSTVFQAILYGLGMEELLGGKNEKTMQSALRDTVEYPEGVFHTVIQSQVFLEIENGEKAITIQRSIKGEKSSKLMRVHYGAILTNPNLDVHFIDTWIHDKGGASNIERGFHSILEIFLKWELPDVHYSSGDFRKLYIQTIFPSFVVEQKSGWADFLATIPFFGIRNVESRSIEFILKLDLFGNEQRKEEIKDRKNNLRYLWKKNIDELNLLARRGAMDILGIPDEPQTISDVTPISIYVSKEGERAPFNEAITYWQNELNDLMERPIASTGQNIQRITDRLKDRQNKLDELTLLWELLNQRLKTQKIKVEQYEQQLVEIREELRQNKDVRKIYNLGGDADFIISKNICPTCSQELNDTLFMPEVHLTPMSIDDNIRYVEAQENMILSFLSVEQKNISSDERTALNLFNELNEIRSEIRYLKQDLISDNRMPSVADIEKRIKIKNKLEFYDKLHDEVLELVNSFYSLSDDWVKILIDEEKLPKSYLSRLDYDKILSLENLFKSFLKRFEYTSKDNRAISISKEIDKKFLLPVVESEGVKYNIRFDSSGSDLIKAIWSYYCALFKVGFEYNTNHPNLLIFDEPAQQGVGSSGFNSMVKELSQYKKGQSFIFSSFNESEDYYQAVVQDVMEFALIDIKERSIMPTK